MIIYGLLYGAVFWLNMGFIYRSCFLMVSWASILHQLLCSPLLGANVGFICKPWAIARFCMRLACSPVVRATAEPACVSVRLWSQGAEHCEAKRLTFCVALRLRITVYTRIFVRKSMYKQLSRAVVRYISQNETRKRLWERKWFKLIFFIFLFLS